MWDNDKERAFDEAVDEIDRKQREKKSVRLIDANKLKAHYAWWKGGGREMTMDEAKSDFDTIIDLQPTVEIVRCKDCKHFNDGDCTELPKLASENDFCSWGERRTDETD